MQTTVGLKKARECKRGRQPFLTSEIEDDRSTSDSGNREMPNDSGSQSDSRMIRIIMGLKKDLTRGNGRPRGVAERGNGVGCISYLVSIKGCTQNTKEESGAQLDVCIPAYPSPVSDCGPPYQADASSKVLRLRADSPHFTGREVPLPSTKAARTVQLSAKMLPWARVISTQPPPTVLHSSSATLLKTGAH